MTSERFLLDTVFIQALLNKRDSYHQQALAFLPRVSDAAEVWITEAVLIEVANALSAINRLAAARFIHSATVLIETRHPDAGHLRTATFDVSSLSVAQASPLRV